MITNKSVNLQMGAQVKLIYCVLLIRLVIIYLFSSK